MVSLWQQDHPGDTDMRVTLALKRLGATHVDYAIPEGLFARKCSKSGVGMNSGWCFEDGVSYAATEELALAEAKEYGCNTLQEAFDKEICYRTDWEELDDDEYYLTDGTVVVTLALIPLDGVLKDVITGLSDYYPETLSSVRHIEVIRALVKPKDTGNAQADYMDLRDQVEVHAKRLEEQDRNAENT